MNRRKFLKALMIVPVAPTVLAASKPELSFIEKFRLARDNTIFKPPTEVEYWVTRLKGEAIYYLPNLEDDSSRIIHCTPKGNKWSMDKPAKEMLTEK